MDALDKRVSLRYNDLRFIRKLEVAQTMSTYMTKQRRALRTFFEAHPDEVFSALQIVQQLEEESISISAVYRNLAALVSEGVVRRHQKEDSREQFYQYVACSHCRGRLHLSCGICEKLFHLSPEHERQILAQMEQLEGFQLSTERTVLHGICAQCNGKEGLDE